MQNFAKKVLPSWAKPALLLGLALAATSPAVFADDKESDDGLTVLSRKERIRMDVVRNLKSSGSYNSKTDRVSLKVKLTNEDPKTEFKDLKAVFIIVAQNMAEKKRFVALAREDFSVSLGIGTADREEEWESKEASTQYYDYRNSEYGEKYDGWILALIDKEDQIIAYKSSKENFEKDIGKINGIRQGSWFGLDMEKVEKPYNRSNIITNSSLNSNP